jgi:hypothetical protein
VAAHPGTLSSDQHTTDRGAFFVCIRSVNIAAVSSMVCERNGRLGLRHAVQDGARCASRTSIAA